MVALAMKKQAVTDDPERRCIATGQSAPKGGLIRFVVAPSGELVPDLKERLPGRGMWVSADRDALGRAVKKKLFAKAAGAAVAVPANLVEMTEQLLVKRCQDIIGLARRSDRLIVGYDRVLESLVHDRIGVVVIAEDAGTGRQSVAEAAGTRPMVGALRVAELGEAAGKGKVAFMVLLHGGLAASLVRENERLSGFRPAGMDA